jgi:hypothetical protein
MPDLYEDVTRRCLCGDSFREHLESMHDIGDRAGVRVRTKCSHAACGCRVFRPKEEQEQHR